MRLVHELEQMFNRELELLSELAAAYWNKTGDVPAGVSRLIGMAAHRRWQFSYVKRVLPENNSLSQSAWLRKFVTDFKAACESHEAAIAAGMRELRDGNLQNQG